MLIRMLILLVFCFLTACSEQKNTTNSSTPGSGLPLSKSQSGWKIAPSGNLNSFFECLEAENLTLISAHRAGSYANYPENALETARYISSKIPALHEIDVATSRDGVLFLMHDDTLERTTTGKGTAKDLDWAKIRTLKLEDRDGKASSFNPPLLEDFLEWSENRAIVQIDFKRSTRYKDVVEMVKHLRAQDRVIYIAYTLAQARRLHQLAPDAMISVSVDSVSELNSVIASGVPANRLIAFTGTDEASPRLNAFLNKQDVEVIFGTLGGSRSLDKKIAKSGDNSLYTELSQNGVDIIATDRPLEAYDALVKNNRSVASAICGISR